MTTPEKSRWIWYDAEGRGRNSYAIFRLVVDRAQEDGGVLHLFADNRYRLRVNGAIVAYGPGRFVPTCPMYDSIELGPWLCDGRNLLTVEVWSPASNNYQAMPESRAGFIAWGSLAGQDLATPGAWQVHRPGAWDPMAPSGSFAQGPTEICDLRQLPTGVFTDPDAAGFADPTPIADTACWGAFEPRSIPPLRHEIDAAAEVLLLATLDRREERIACRQYAQDLKERRRRGDHGKLRFPYAVSIHSPRNQQVQLGLFWGPHWCNGAPCAMVADPLLGNRENTTVQLRAGWNLLYGEPEMLTECWGMQVAVPRAAGLRLAATPEDGTDALMRYGPVLPEEELAAARGGAGPADAAACDRLPWSWTTVTAGQTGVLPARSCAWDRPAGVLASRVPATFPMALAPGEGHVLVLDFGTEMLGHTVVELDAPAGTVVDVGLDERLRSDGLLTMYTSSPFTDLIDRLICDDSGRQSLEAFHPRGGRYLQVHIRPPDDDVRPVRLYGIGIRSAQVPVARDGTFRCSDPVFEWAWEAGWRTLQACVEDAYLDCPWRERGTYLGDALVEAGTMRSYSRDQAVTERCIDLWAQGQLPDGQMQCCVPSWHRTPHEDFTLIWILLQHEHWRHSGDRSRVERWWDVLEGILASSAWRSGASGLWDASDLHVFVDWGCPREGKRAADHAVLNAFRYQALRCAADLADLLGLDARATAWRAEADEVRAAFRRVLWDADAGRFATGTEAGALLHSDGDLHANILALAFGLYEEGQLEACLRWTCGRLEDNCRLAALGANGAGQAELYFLSYAYQALYAHGRADLAEQVIREHYGLMQRYGAWTIWECLNRGVRGGGSLCHAWSCGPSIVARERILGVRPAGDGEPGRILVAPDSHLAWAAGTVPLPQGDVQVHWRREGQRLHLQVRAPEAIAVEVRPGPSFDGCELVLD
ncbi:MAG: family 78 glycoside hydrolase catalytic domain [Planctomycetota bacterium]